MSCIISSKHGEEEENKYYTINEQIKLFDELNAYEYVIYDL